MVKFLTIEFIDETIKEIACDDCREDGASLMYYIRFGQNEGEHHIPYSQIKSWKVK